MTDQINDTTTMPPEEPFQLAWMGALLPPERREEFSSWTNWFKHLWATYESDQLPSSWSSSSTGGLRSGVYNAPCGPPPSDYLSPKDLQGFARAGEALARSRKPTGVTENAVGFGSGETDEERIPSTPEAALREAILPSCRHIASKLGFGGTWRHESVDGVVLSLIGLEGIRRLMLDIHPISPFGEALGTSSSKLTDAERDRLLWRQCVLIRQNLANAVPLSLDMRPLNRRRFKIWWFTALEWTRLAEHAYESFRDSGFVLPLRSRVQIQWQALFSRTTFR